MRTRAALGADVDRQCLQGEQSDGLWEAVEPENVCSWELDPARSSLFVRGRGQGRGLKH